MKRPKGSALPSWMREHIQQTGIGSAKLEPMDLPVAPTTTIQPAPVDTILPQPVGSLPPVEEKTYDTSPPTIANTAITKKKALNMSRLIAAGIGSQSSPVNHRWREQAEELRDENLEVIEAAIAQGLYTKEEEAALKANLNGWLDKCLDTPDPLSKSNKHLALWLKNKFGIETYELNHFWSRHYPSTRWKKHLFGSTKGLTTYRTGFLYEIVPASVLRHELQEQSDRDPVFRSVKGEPVGTIGTQRRKDILEELKTMLDPFGNASAYPKFGDDQEAGIATTEHTPKWLSIQVPVGKQNYEIVAEEVGSDRAARFALSCSYDPAAKCPVFDKFLDQTFDGAPDKQEQIDCFFTWMAAAVFGITSKYKRALFFYGTTDTGKSVVLDLISDFFPLDAQTNLTFEQMNERFAKAALATSRINIVREVKKAALKSGGFDSEVFKTAVGGESLQAEIKHGDLFTFVPRVAFVFGANGKIPLTNQGAAVHNRISVLHFRNQVAKEDQDVDLIQKLRTEMSGILNRILDAGVHLLETRSFIDPQTSKDLKAKWSSQVSSINAWLSECCVEHKKIGHGEKKTKTTPTSVLYRSYVRWCETQGIKPTPKGAYWGKLEERGIHKTKGNDGERAPVVVHNQPTDGMF
tara:strand:- start:1257 stop:3161 length:1905 start_codon:yes stop_codon:yes gene_type:complete